MKNKKAQELGIGIILLTFVAILVGVILFQAIAQQVGSSVTTGAFYNTTIGTLNAGDSYVFTDYKLLDGVTVTNSTDGVLVPATNYTITNNYISNGALSVLFTLNAGEFDGESFNVSATTAHPTGYISDSGGRALANLIPIMFALALAVVALVPTLRSKIIDALGK